ncbi:hypothetical protein DWG18_08805 [Lysobacter sp. TY2-98]|uniref:hypothetical protein n=1 Tax=Lysobacter sp. TY2-98 TaxID=2290922 RepID=UPI000E20C188|nr:hypothetical protein [Lysobacter sp. TY2-98]AXK72362.1 hypothetical protein DWG18_08805 [Lysobacter sp. TY2-98]
MRRFATAFLPMLLLAGCASAGAGGGRSLAAGTPATLATGDTVTLPDASTLTYVGVTSDSRCRPNVQCIQAGTAIVAFKHAMGGMTHDVVLDSGKAPAADLGDTWRLVLVSLDFASPPNATIRVDRR